MLTQTSKFLIDVVPIVRLPFSRQQFFSYLHDSELPAGTLVSIPLFHRNIEGIVINSKPDFQHIGNYELKKINAVLVKELITKQQLQLAEQISNYYLTSLGVVLKHFLPKRIKSRSPISPNITIKLPAIKLTTEQQNAVSTISSSKQHKFLLFGPASSGKTEIYIHSILALKKQNPDAQFLILVPELTLAPQALQRYEQYFTPDEIVALHSKLPKGLFFDSWNKIKNNQAKIIISTRIGIFAPFANLGLIVIDEEQDMSYKQWDMNPRYDARMAAEFLSANFQCPLVFGTATPRIDTFYRAKEGEIKLLKIPKLPEEIMGRKLADPSIEIVDMRKEKWTDFAGKKKPNYSFLSIHLQNELNYYLANKQQAILFINHQGMSSFSVCTNCKEVIKCPNCESALVYDETGTYKCIHCNYSTDAFPTCKKCGNLSFQNLGLGTQAVVREVKKLLPKANVARLDTQSIKKAGAQEQVFKDFSERRIDILVGTQMITKGWDNPNVGLVAIIDADSLFSFPDYLTGERAYANIMQTIGRTGRVGSRFNGSAIIQTYNPQKVIFNYLQEKNFEGFFQKELSQREGLSYPPYGKLIKLVLQTNDNKKREKELDKTYNSLLNICASFPDIKVSAPAKPLVSKVRGKERMQILVKNKNFDSNFPKELIKIIGTLSSEWFVDVDPINLA